MGNEATDDDMGVRGGRAAPNILVTGTPGTGKTSLCHQLAASVPLQYINIGDLVKEKELHDGWDEEYQSWNLNEDKLCDELEDRVAEGGCLLDYHGCELFPERWFDLVVVLQTDNSVLYDRLVARGYSGRKLEDNMECEIMQVILEEARESYEHSKVLALPSNSVEDMEQNVETISQWLKSWKSNPS
ncbi:Hydroxyacyl-ACP Dehydrase [Klebsormidium nitens]|uniref:Adenylate kinase isoenzyme 6 homolog n=1 Tax=Klebsormidium nitens TaxID=105231 RepID=A0A1Y1I7T5_KLENI|nr:Hydroxyacyl-ACP Dehydrase [Klebsormidium nitens]|eukprot:GAQ87010.1 Hydroxyacyl-ACP Dehydrase [Klebsormidium nitens]